MAVFKDIRTTNTLLNALSLRPEDKIIAIRENELADANFILPNLMQQFFSTANNKVCLVIMHNTLGHYQNVGKRLGYNFLNKIQSGHAVIIEPLKSIANVLGNEDDNPNINFLSCDKESIVRELFIDIKNKIDELLKDETDGQVFLIIDDVSHLLDLGIDISYVVIFVNYCTNLISNGRVSVVINCHVSSASDRIIANALGYVADLNIEVSPLKTGISHDVSGVISINRREESAKILSKQNVYHYRAYDQEVKVFAPGESLFYLCK